MNPVKKTSRSGRPGAATGDAARISPTEKKRTRRLLAALREAYPSARCTLHHQGPLQLLVATILAAQCTDTKVNEVTPSLFRKYRTAADLAAAHPAELEEDIHSTGFFRAKARSLRGLGAALVARHGGRVPRDLDSLVALPGVGRKTANVVLGNAFHIASGIVVDTHVARVAGRLGLASGRDPVRIERELMKRIPESEWIDVSHRLIQHGREVCRARTPRCADCSLRSACPSANLLDEPRPSTVRRSAGTRSPNLARSRRRG